MRVIFADFDLMTEAGNACLTTRGSQKDIESAGLQPGDWAWLSDGELLVGGQLATDDRYGLVCVLEWDTLVQLEDDDSHDYLKYLSEIQRLLGRSADPLQEPKRVFELSTILEIVAPPEIDAAFPPGFFSARRAEALALLGKYDLALLEIEDARRQSPDDPDNACTFLEIVRRLDLPRARREAEALASGIEVSSSVLALCVNVLATCAEDLPDDQFEPVAEKILEWAGRFERARGREWVRASIFALFQFNRGVVLLRLGRGEAAREALKLANAVDPVFPGIDEATRLTVYDEGARELAVRVRARPTAA
jgi:tetratricopeptide (TPR) repeat protein